MICPCGESAVRDGLCQDCLDYTAEKRAERLERRIVGSGLPPALQRIEIPKTQAGAIARKWAKDEFPGLCLTGPIGVGKTHLAAAATWLRLQAQPTRWVAVSRLMTQMRAGFADESRKIATKAILDARAVVLDDLDKVTPSDYGREVIFAAVDGRVQAGTPLLVTTNLALSELGDKLGDAVMSRLAGYCHAVKLDGPDQRLAA
jgi:DNA replication protein DnaC